MGARCQGYLRAVRKGVLPDKACPTAPNEGEGQAVGAAGGSHQPTASGTSVGMGLSCGQDGLSAQQWGSGSGPVRVTRVRYSPRMAGQGRAGPWG